MDYADYETHKKVENILRKTERFIREISEDIIFLIKVHEGYSKLYEKFPSLEKLNEFKNILDEVYLMGLELNKVVRWEEVYSEIEYHKRMLEAKQEEMKDLEKK